MVMRGGEPMLLTLSDRLRPPGVGFGVGWIHMYPSSLDQSVLDRVRGVAFDAVRELGLRDGIAFPQLIAAGDDVRMVEVAARIAAGQMADLVRFGTGVELFAIAIAQALGRPVSDELVTPTVRRPIAIRFLTASPGVLPLGTVSDIEGLDQVRSSRGVLGAGLYFGAGATITPVQVDADRRGYIVATGETPEAALALADAAAGRLVVRTLQNVAT
jgi:biotin carboxylase